MTLGDISIFTLFSRSLFDSTSKDLRLVFFWGDASVATVDALGGCLFSKFESDLIALFFVWLFFVLEIGSAESESLLRDGIFLLWVVGMASFVKKNKF